MRDVWGVVDAALSTVDLAAVLPRHRRCVRMHAVNLLLACEGMRRHRRGSIAWRRCWRICDDAARDLQTALGRSQTDALVRHLENAARGSDEPRVA